MDDPIYYGAREAVQLARLCGDEGTLQTTLLFSIDSALFAQNTRRGDVLSPMAAYLHYAPHFLLCPGRSSEHQINAASPPTGLRRNFGRNVLHTQAARQAEHEYRP